MDKFIDTFFRDKNDNLVLFQPPNIPIIGWAICTLLVMLIQSSPVSTGIMHLGSAFLFTWAYLEISDGANYFRRTLGVIIIAVVLFGYFGTV